MFHVLVTDDQPNARKLLETVLRRNGYEVYTAENGLAALQAMEEHHIDIILLDIMMPGMDGYEFTRELRENGDNTPILMITARQLKLYPVKRTPERVTFDLTSRVNGQ